MAPITVFWFIREGDKFIQCNKEAFDKAIQEGKSIKYHGYPDRKTERIAETLEAQRMSLLADPNCPPKLRVALTNPVNVCEVEVIRADEPDFWTKEAKRPKYQ
jgi:hypothetical protein